MVPIPPPQPQHRASPHTTPYPNYGTKLHATPASTPAPPRLQPTLALAFTLTHIDTYTLLTAHCTPPTTHHPHHATHYTLHTTSLTELITHVSMQYTLRHMMHSIQLAPTTTQLHYAWCIMHSALCYVMRSYSIYNVLCTLYSVLYYCFILHATKDLLPPDATATTYHMVTYMVTHMVHTTYCRTRLLG